MNNKELALLGARVLEDKKACDVTVIDIQDKASFADYMIICHGSSQRQVGSLTDYVEEAYAKENLIAKSIEGNGNSQWILMDFGDIIVNLFTEEARAKYNLEKVWGDCPRIDIE